MLKKGVLLAVLIFVLVTTSPGTATAQEAVPGDKWQFGAELYGWAASMGGTSAAGGDIDIGFSEVIDALEFGGMGAFEARKGKWSLMTDVIYLDMKDDTDVAPGEKLNVELKGWIVTPTVGYSVIDSDRARLDILAGVRYLWLKTELGFGGALYPAKGHVWDGVIGLRGRLNLTEKWFMPFYGDIGTGDSDLTWQAMAGIGYRFKRFDLIAAYRYLDWEFDDDSKVLDDLDVSGPYAGIVIRF